MFRGTRTEALSDAVFAIALTILVLDLRTPPIGEFARALLEDWPAYLAYLVAFLTIIMIWVNHHAVFARIRVVDPPTLLLNAGLLLGTSLVPWPTALISAAIRGGERGDESAAVVVYAVVTLIVALSWGTLNRRLSFRPDRLVEPGAARWLRRNSWVAYGSILPAVVAVAVAAIAPIAALVLLLALLVASLAANFRSSYDAAIPTQTERDAEQEPQPEAGSETPRPRPEARG